MDQIHYLLTFITATVVSMVVIPLMVHLAPRLGMIDRPDPRKVHTAPVPRVGGVGIVLGSLLPILLWSPLNQWLLAFVLGAVVLLVFGVWDDMRELGHYAKFLGQIIAAVLVVYYGDIYITQLPFITFDDAQVTFIGKPFTIFAIVGMINALNTSDGLDGLAGGMSLLSLGCIAYLAFLADNDPIIMIAIAALGGVFGFLRYNTHPARVFMGDGGSQFLGFTLGVLAVVLTQEANPVLSPVLALLILGLPIVDIVVVMVRRMRRGAKWYRPHKDHVHHRLLQLKFHHYEAVMIIYSIQMFFIACAIFLSYESDVLLMSIYLSTSALLFLFLSMAERNTWYVHRANSISGFAEAIRAIRANKLLTAAPVYFVGIAIPVLFVTVSLLAKHIPRDFGIIAAVMAAAMMVHFVARVAVTSVIVQAVHYITAAFVVYLETRHFSQYAPPGFEILEIVYFLTLAGAIGLIIRYGEKWDFKITPMDYLVIFVVLIAGYILHSMPDKVEVGLMAVKLIVVFYGCELIVLRMRRKLNALNVSSLITLFVLAYRGIA
jgi:UDP-GlcNAc:undecaprenyl-phosphate GlcNAc-1-phosphate transferase